MFAAALSPLKALQAATVNAAAVSGVAEEVGSIAVGGPANMILLDANPLMDIRYTRQRWPIVMLSAMKRVSWGS
jgi:imidazolonepropionase-like amidohydrolase